MSSTKKRGLDDVGRWSKVTDQGLGSIARYPSGEEPSMRKLRHPFEPSFLLGMAMVFGYGTPLSNRVMDRLMWKRVVAAGEGISESWRAVADDFGSVIQYVPEKRKAAPDSGA
jgi:hypothetical protein